MAKNKLFKIYPIEKDGSLFWGVVRRKTVVDKNFWGVKTGSHDEWQPVTSNEIVNYEVIDGYLTRIYKQVVFKDKETAEKYVVEMNNLFLE